MPPELYWTLSPLEVAAFMEAIGERQKQERRDAWLRAGLVAAVILNAAPGRRKGAPARQPEDFVPASLGGNGGGMDPATYDRLRELAQGDTLIRA